MVTAKRSNSSKWHITDPAWRSCGNRAITEEDRYIEEGDLSEAVSAVRNRTAGDTPADMCGECNWE